MNASAGGDRRTGRALVALAACVTAVFVALPLLSIVLAVAAGPFAAVRATLVDPDAASAIRLTAVVTILTVFCNTAFGLLAAWTVTKYRFPGKTLLLSLIDVPLAVSPVVAGLAILLAFGTHAPIGASLAAAGLKIAFAPPGIALATIFVTFPYVAREAIALMREQGRDMEETAMLLGASLSQTFARVTFPVIRTALFDGILLCNARAMGEFGAVSVISGKIRGLTDTVPLHIEMLYEQYDTVGALTLAGLLALVTIALTLIRSVRREHRAATPTAAI